MLIAGVEKLTALDFPGRLAAVVFTPGCNFRCGFCHNPHLVDENRLKETKNDLIPEESFFNFLKHRKGLLEGVCVSGGEPTIQPGLVEFALKIKKAGFLVKIDTNGANSKTLENLIKEKAVDFLAMDIKTSLPNYKDLVGLNIDIGCRDLTSDVDVVLREVKKSKELIQNSGLPYEFRTTAIKEIHNFEIFEEIGEWIEGANDYYIQNFRNKTVLDEKYKKMSGFSDEELLKIKSLMETYVKHCGIRT